MNDRKNLAAIHNGDQDLTIHPQAFVFFDKKTGTRRFEVKANANGGLPVDQVAGLLAVQCVMRGQTPKDFGVLVAAAEELLDGLEKQTEKLILDCKLIQSPIRLTRREQEVLREVLRGSTNKEIAEKVHISVRTVKFHISALLAKFGVAGRMDLMRKAGDMLPQQKDSNERAIPMLVTDPKLRGGQAHGNPDGGRAGTTGLERRSYR